jgi:lysozyme
LIYNIGGGAFKDSTLLKELNRGNYAAVPDQFRVWNKITIPKTQQKVVSKGLTDRREAEAQLFMTPPQ